MTGRHVGQLLKAKVEKLAGSAKGTREARRAPQSEASIADLRRRALAALNLGLPEPAPEPAETAAEPAASKQEADRESDCEILEVRLSPVGDNAELDRHAVVEAPPPPDTVGEPAFRCTCLRRNGVCECSNNRAWLLSKRREVSTYAPPHLRHKASRKRPLPPEGEETSPGAATAPIVVEVEDVPGDIAEKAAPEQSFTCTCLRRAGFCTCQSDNAWLRKKRVVLVPYVPPHARARQDEADRVRVNVSAADVNHGEEESARGSANGSACSQPSTNLRVLARRWKSQLESVGSCCFNPLQMDATIHMHDAERLVAESVEHTFASKGVKGLPVVRGGSYQFEVELLRDSAIVVGWSGAMTLPADFDFQGYGYASDGSAYQGIQDFDEYGPPFGKAGDIVGACARWHGNDSDDPDEVSISFYLNGRSLGTAFHVKLDLVNGVVPVPLQPHVCQSPHGSLMHILLRGATESSPLLYPVDGCSALSDISEAHFCPFSEAVTAASAERAAKGVTDEHLRHLSVPDANLAELYDIQSGMDVAALTSHVAASLGFTKQVAAKELRIRVVEHEIALLACRRPAHVQRLVAKGSGVDAGRSEGISARHVRDATASTITKVREWRGEDTRLQRDRTTARRLIHGHLDAPMPLSHIMEEKQQGRLRAAPQA